MIQLSRKGFFGEEFFRRFFDELPEIMQHSLGSGVIVDPSGIVPINAHVIGRATDIEVITADSKQHRAKAVEVDKRTDLAVLRLQGSGPYPLPCSGTRTRSMWGTGCWPSAPPLAEYIFGMPGEET